MTWPPFISNAIIGAALLAAVSCASTRTANEPEAGVARGADEETIDPVLPRPPPLDPLEVAKLSWAQRDNRSELALALAVYEALANESPDDPTHWTRLSQGYFLLANNHMRLTSDEQAMVATFELGVLAGERAMMAASPEFAQRVRQGERVEDAVASIPAAGQGAIYWYATNLGRFALAKDFTTVLFYKDRVYAMMKRVLEIDETFLYGAPHRYLGAFYAKAPSFVGGDLKQSRKHFERALVLGADYVGNKVVYAELYATRAADRGLFEQLLREAIAADPTTLPEVIPEQKLEQLRAQQLLEQADELF